MPYLDGTSQSFTLLRWKSTMALRSLMELVFEGTSVETFLSLQIVEIKMLSFPCVDGATGFSLKPCRLYICLVQKL